MIRTFFSQPANWVQRHPRLWLTIIWAVMTLPGMFRLPVTDRDEARFAQATRQMVQTGDYIRIFFQDDPRDKKPVGIHWLQAASASIGHHLFHIPLSTIWLYRIPSAVSILLALLILHHVSRKWWRTGPFASLLAPLLLGCSILTQVEAQIATTDAALLLTSVIVMAWMVTVFMMETADAPDARHQSSPRSDAAPLSSDCSISPTLPHPAWFWAALGAAILVKGPVLPFIVMVAYIAMSVILWRFVRGRDRLRAWMQLWRRSLRWCWLTAVIAMPWYIAVQIQTHGQFIHDAFSGDLLPKLVGGQESHGLPPGAYSLMTTATFWPGSLVVLGSLILAVRLLYAQFRKKSSWLDRRELESSVSANDVALLLGIFCWLGPAWIVFELIPTKLPHYVLPLFPALSVVCAVFITDVQSVERLGKPFTSRRAQWIGWSLWALIAISMVLAVEVILPLWLSHPASTAASSWFSTVVTSLSPFAILSMAGCAAVILLLNPKSENVISRSDHNNPRRASVWLVWIPLATMCVTVPMTAIILPGINGLWVSRSLITCIEQDLQGIGSSTSDSSAPVVISGDYHEPSLVFGLPQGNVELTDTVVRSIRSAITHVQTPDADDHQNPNPFVYLILPTNWSTPAHLKEAQAQITLTPVSRITGLNYSKGNQTDLTVYRCAPTHTIPKRD